MFEDEPSLVEVSAALPDPQTYEDQVLGVVSLLDVPAVPGTKVIALQVDDVMEAWAKNTQELAMDSTCQYRINTTLASLLIAFQRGYKRRELRGICGNCERRRFGSASCVRDDTDK